MTTKNKPQKAPILSKDSAKSPVFISKKHNIAYKPYLSFKSWLKREGYKYPMNSHDFTSSDTLTGHLTGTPKSQKAGQVNPKSDKSLDRTTGQPKTGLTGQVTGLPNKGKTSQARDMLYQIYLLDLAEHRSDCRNKALSHNGLASEVADNIHQPDTIQQAMSLLGEVGLNTMEYDVGSMLLYGYSLKEISMILQLPYYKVISLRDSVRVKSAV